jgi:hypothetical protein
MAFTFIVETGLGIANANSYVTVEEADDYMASNIHGRDAWNALDVEDKQHLLVWSTRFIDQRAIWNGYKSSAGNSLRWPRSGVYDRDKYYVDDFSIPTPVKQAVVELAAYLLVADPNVTQGSDGLSKLKVDVIELTFNGNQKLSQFPLSIAMILDGLGVLRSGNGGHAKILRA